MFILREREWFKSDLTLPAYRKAGEIKCSTALRFVSLSVFCELRPCQGKKERRGRWQRLHRPRSKEDIKGKYLPPKSWTLHEEIFSPFPLKEFLTLSYILDKRIKQPIRQTAILFCFTDSFTSSKAQNYQNHQKNRN